MYQMCHIQWVCFDAYRKNLENKIDVLTQFMKKTQVMKWLKCAVFVFKSKSDSCKFVVFLWNHTKLMKNYEKSE